MMGEATDAMVVVMEERASAAQIEHVFDPFHSTKPRDGALGIGLCLAYAIAREHGGDLRIESRVGEGTTVRLYLPARREG